MEAIKKSISSLENEKMEVLREIVKLEHKNDDFWTTTKTDTSGWTSVDAFIYDVLYKRYRYLNAKIDSLRKWMDGIEAK